MQHGIWAGRYTFDPDLAIGWMKECENFGRTVAEVLVRLASRISLGTPGLAGMGYRLKWPCLIGTPNRQSHRFARAISILDQLFLDSASGSVTTFIPLFRLRCEIPVAHHVRLR